MSLLNTLIPSRNQAPAEAGENRGVDQASKVRPVYDIRETADAFAVTVYLPGVNKDGLEITAEEDQIRIVGRRAWRQPEGWAPRHRESLDAAFELVLAHENTIDNEKIDAELRDGVLRVALPKHEAVKPRKIAIN